MKDHYTILGVEPDADHETIKAAFRALAKKYHPDTAVDPAAAKTSFRELKEAHLVLSNPQFREEYDRLLSPKRLGLPLGNNSDSVQYSESIDRGIAIIRPRGHDEASAPLGWGSVVALFFLVILMAIAQLAFGG